MLKLMLKPKREEFRLKGIKKHAFVRYMRGYIFYTIIEDRIGCT